MIAILNGLILQRENAQRASQQYDGNMNEIFCYNTYHTSKLFQEEGLCMYSFNNENINKSCVKPNSIYSSLFINVDICFFEINYNNTHYVLVRVSITLKMLEYIDHMGVQGDFGKDCYYLNQVLHFLQVLIEFYCQDHIIIQFIICHVL